MTVLDPAAASRPWRKAALWLAFLAPFFYVTYGFANWLASRRADVGEIIFDWEQQIPFLAWTIVPYWSINAFYALSLFVCRDERELGVLGRRLLVAQVVAVTCFLLLPLRLTFERPATEGVPGFMFAVLGGFDMPYNQAPSLHIALLVILAEHYNRHITAWWRWPLNAWFALVGVSVLTTWQHHFIDVPTGALLGLLTVWALPRRGEGSLSQMQVTSDPKRRQLATRYAAGALLCAALAFVGGGWLWLLWPATSLFLVAVCYAAVGAAGFQKDADGRLSPAARVLFLPYLAGAWLNARLWTRNDAAADPVMDGVWIARMPLAWELGRLPSRRLVDLCAELSAPSGLAAYRGVTSLDLVPLAGETLRDTAAAIEALRRDGPVVVVCALGYGRSAAAVAAWLVATGRVPDVEAAIAQLRAIRPRIAIDAPALGRALAPRTIPGAAGAVA
jgi:hypothetical protein